MCLPPHYGTPILQVIAHLKDPTDLSPITSIVLNIDSGSDDLSGYTPIFALEFRDIHHIAATGGQKEFEIPHICGPVNVAAILKDAARQGAVDEEHFGKRTFLCVENVMSIVREDPIPRTIA